MRYEFLKKQNKNHNPHNGEQVNDLHNLRQSMYVGGQLLNIVPPRFLVLDSATSVFLIPFFACFFLFFDYNSVKLSEVLNDSSN